MKSIKDIYRSTTHGVSNLIKWFPHVWGDYDWDSQAIYEVLKFKLELMEKSFRKYGYAMGSNKRADEMKRCINILNRLIEDKYDEEECDPIDKKWGEIEMTSEPIEGRKDVSKLLLNRANVITTEDKKQERKETRIAMHKADSRRKYDLEYLFDYMKKHIRTWWD